MCIIRMISASYSGAANRCWFKEYRQEYSFTHEVSTFYKTPDPESSIDLSIFATAQLAQLDYSSSDGSQVKTSENTETEAFAEEFKETEAGSVHAERELSSREVTQSASLNKNQSETPGQNLNLSDADPIKFSMQNTNHNQVNLDVQVTTSQIGMHSSNQDTSVRVAADQVLANSGEDSSALNSSYMYCGCEGCSNARLGSDEPKNEWVSSAETAALPTYSYDQIAEQLNNDYWVTKGYISDGEGIKFNVGGDNSLKVDISSLTYEGQLAASRALDSWTNVTGINFILMDEDYGGTAEIFFDDANEGAYATSTSWFRSGDGYTQGRAFINVDSNWTGGGSTNIDSYYLQTYIHEIGHALGLGHAGNYNSSASYSTTSGSSNQYLNDSWQATVMSYFSQTTNTSINADFAYVVTPQIADIIAIRDLYGLTYSNTGQRTGNTTYGENSTAGGIWDSFGSLIDTITFTIFDEGGIDTVDLGSTTVAHTIDLRSEGISSINGNDGNVIIARGTVLENVKSGSGSDTIIGNSADNVIAGGGGADTIDGGAGSDTAEFSGNRANYTVSISGTTATVIKNGVTTSLSNVEFAKFDDTTISLEDLSNSNTAPVATINDLSLAAGASTSVASLVSYSDSDGDAAQKYVVWDSEGANSFYLSGTAVDARSGFVVSADQLANLTLKGDTSAGTQTLWISAHDGTEWGAWDAFTLTTTSTGRETESNNSIATADLISSGVAVTGQSSSYSDDDYFKIEATAAGTISVAFAGDSDTRGHYVSIVNASGNILTKTQFDASGTAIAEVGAAGFYYVLVEDEGYGERDDYSLTATFSGSNTGRETEPNNSIATADLISSGVAVTGQSSSYSDDDYFKIEATAAGTISVAFAGDSDTRGHYVSIVNASGNILTKTQFDASGTAIAEVGAAGFYYVLVEDEGYGERDDYSLTATFSGSNTGRETEPNNSIATADLISSGVAVTGQSSSYSDDDYFKIEATAAGTISVAFAGDSDTRGHYVSIVNASGNILTKTQFDASGTAIAEVGAAGFYYVLVEDEGYGERDDYSLTATFSGSNTGRETEPNNSIATADLISSGVAVTGQSSSYSDDDYFKIEATAAGTISVAFAGDSDTRGHYVSIVNASGNILTKTQFDASGTAIAEVGAAGFYYVLVEDEGYGERDDYSLTATFSGSNTAPVATINDLSLAAGASTSVASLVSYSDSDGDAAQKYMVWDSKGANSFYLSGTAIYARSGFVVSADQLANLTLKGDTSAGTQTLWIRAHDGTEWGGLGRLHPDDDQLEHCTGCYDK